MNVKVKAVQGCKVGYARVSSEDQNLGRQFEAFKKIGIEKIFYEKAQGDAFGEGRPELLNVMKYIREGDTLYFCSFDRLSRNHIQLLNLIEEIKSKGVSICFIEEHININPSIENPYDELNANIFSAFAHFFKKQLKRRQKQGIDLAKQSGTYKGRTPKLNNELKLEVMRSIILDDVCSSKVEKKYKISRSTVWRIAYKDPSLNDERNKLIKGKLEKKLKDLNSSKY